MAPPASGACDRRRPSASPSSGWNSTGGRTSFGARQIVAEKLSLVSGSLPPQVERPILAPISSIMGEILFFAISSDVDDPLTLRTIADTIVRRRLLAVAGVSQVTPIGGAERQFQVVAHPGSAPRQQHLGDRAARRRSRRQPEHVGRHLHGRTAGVRAADDRPGADARTRSATASWRFAATDRCWCATSPTCARARRSSAARDRATASRPSSSASRSSQAPTPSS